MNVSIGRPSSEMHTGDGQHTTEDEHNLIDKSQAGLLLNFFQILAACSGSSLCCSAGAQKRSGKHLSAGGASSSSVKERPVEFRRHDVRILLSLHKLDVLQTWLVQSAFVVPDPDSTSPAKVLILPIS